MGQAHSRWIALFLIVGSAAACASASIEGSPTEDDERPTISVDPKPDAMGQNDVVSEESEVRFELWSGTARSLALPDVVSWWGPTQFVLALEPSAGSLWLGDRQLRTGDVVDGNSRAGSTFIYRATSTQAKGGDRFRWVVMSRDGRSERGFPYRAMHAAPPLNDIDGLILWLDAADGGAKGASGKAAENGEAIATWTDRSRSQQHAVVARHASAPTFEDGAVRMNGGNESMVSDAHALSSGPGMTYVAALRVEHGSMNEVGGVVATAAGRSGLFTGEDLLLSRSFPSWTVGRLAPQRWSVAVSTTDYRVVQGHRVSVDGAVVSIDSEKASIFDRPETRVGDTISSIDQAFDGLLGEVMLFDQPLGASDQRLVERYLASKWSEAVIHDLRVDGRTSARGFAKHRDFMIAGSEGALLEGWNGDDVLSSGPGNDDLSGGGGADHYIFGSDAGGSNIIRDYVPSDGDVIDLSGILAEASGGLGQHIRTAVSSHGTLVSIDKDGVGGFVADLWIEVPVAGLDPASLETGLETSAVGLVDLTLSLPDGQSDVSLGDPTRLVLEGTFGLGGSGAAGPGGPVQHHRIVSSDVRYTSSQSGAAINARGILSGLRPGTTTITAHFGGQQAEIEIDVEAAPSRPFAQVGEPRAFGTEPGAHQGLIFVGDEIFVSSNVPLNPSGINGYVYRMDRDFVIQDQAGIKPESFGDRSHIGALGEYGGKLWAPFIDLNEHHQLVAVGMVRIDPVTLALESFVDLSAYTSFQDAICFSGDNVWLAPGAGLLMRAPMTADGPDMEAAVRYSIHGGVGVMQGLTCRGDTLYVVPQISSTHPEARGIVAFDIPSLVADPRVPNRFGARPGLTSYNVPEYRYSVAYPSAEDPYHESFSFDPEDPNTIYLPFLGIENQNFIELRLDP